MAYYEMEGGETTSSQRYWRLPKEVPVGMNTGNGDPPTLDSESSSQMPPDGEGGKAKVAQEADVDEEDAVFFLQELEILRDDMDVALRSSLGPAALARSGRLAHYTELTKKIRSRERRPVGKYKS